MTELQKQKLLEFAGENIRWDDMVRWYGNDPAKLKAIMHERKTDLNIMNCFTKKMKVVKRNW